MLEMAKYSTNILQQFGHTARKPFGIKIVKQFLQRFQQQSVD